MTRRTGGSGDVAVTQFIERFAVALAATGFPRMAARIFVAILISDTGRRTAAELSSLLHVSPAAVSGGVRYLEQLGLIARGREPGDRRDHYRIYDDMWYTALTKRDETLARLEQELTDGIKAIGPDTPGAARLDETRRFYEFARMEFGQLMVKWRDVHQEARKRDSR